MPRRALGPVIALLLAATPAAAQEGEWVIPPGMETAAMQLFAGTFVAGRCSFQGASLDRAVAVARYRCEGVASPVEVEAKHPSRAHESAVRTQSFALAARPAPTAPAGLVEEVAEQVRRTESAWRWTHVSPQRAPAPSVDAGARPHPSPESTRFVPAQDRSPARSRRCALGVILLVALVSAGWWWSRRRDDEGQRPM